MNLFESVRGIDNVTMMSTNCEGCVPYEYLESQEAAGYKFKVAGKFVKRKEVASAVKKALDEGIGIRRSEVIVEEDAEPEIHIDLAQSEDVTAMNQVPVKKSKEVRCIETGKVYVNQSAAARDLGIDPAQVSDSIKTGRKRSGYTFERVEG